MNILLMFLKKLPTSQKLGGAAVFLALLLFLVQRIYGTKAAVVALVGILLVVALFAGLNAYLKWRNKKKGEAFHKDLKGQSAEAGVSKTEVRRALAELSEQWTKAVDELKRGGFSLYSLPWYLLIGEPQSGKSTTLRNSGLDFPVGTEALSGAGGTRNCDWWFTNEAVILDTAGRFTFQEDNAPDAQEWGSFLNLLRRHRRRCPINGVIVVVPATSLLEDSAEVREEKAQNVRNKLRHIQQVLGVQYPVYLLLTKCDKILGFAEFFSRLEADGRRQLFGWSNHEKFTKAYDPKEFGPTFDELTKTIDRWRMQFLYEDIGQSQVDKLYVFPEEFATLKAPIADYLKTIFMETKFHSPLFFRGYYFTSGMQEGVPVARACAELLRTERGEAAGPSPVLEALEKIFEKSRAFFIRDFYKDKVFAERNLLMRSPEAIKRDRMIHRLAWFGGTALAVLSLCLLVWGTLAFKSGLGKIKGTMEQARVMAQSGAAQGPEEALALAKTLSGQAEEAFKTRAYWVFFRTRDNRLTEDIGMVHGALLEGKCMAPLVQLTGRRLADPASVSGVPFELYHEALREYTKWWVLKRAPERLRNKELPRLRLSPLLAFATAAQPSRNDPSVAVRWLGSGRFDSKLLLEQFDFYINSGKGDPTVLLGGANSQSDMGEVVDNLAEYWRMERVLPWWFKTADSTEVMDRSHGTLLTLERSGAGGWGVDLDRFRQSGGAFNKAAGELKELIKSGPGNEGATLADALAEAKRRCNVVYDDLSSLLPEDSGSQEISWLAERLQKEKLRAMELVARDFDSRIRVVLENRPHLVLLTAQGPQLGSHVDPVDLTLGKVVSFCDLKSPDSVREFDDWARSMQADPSRGYDALRSWHQAQAGRRDTIQRDLSAFPAGQLDQRWSGPLLVRVLGAAAGEGVLARDIGALERYLSVGSPSEEAGGGRPPERFTLATCERTLKEFGSVISWYRQEVARGDPRVEEISRRLTGPQLKYLHDYLAYWNSALKSFRPNVKASDWRAFKQQVSPSAGPLYGALDWPLDPLLRNVPPDIDQLIGYVPGARADGSVQEAWDAIKKPLRAYGSQGSMNALRQAWDDFAQCLRQTSDDPLEAWRQIAAGTKSGQAVPSFRALTAISSLVAGNLDLEQEYVANQLVELEGQAISLLTGPVSQEFNREWEKLSRDYRTNLEGRFPFAGAQVSSQSRPGLLEMTIPACELNTLREFLGQAGLKGLSDRYGLEALFASKNPKLNFLGPDQRAFFSSCLNWYNFLYDERGDEKTHDLEVEFEPRVEGLPRGTSDAGTKFTVVYFKAPGGINLRYRPSSEGNERQSASWRPGPGGLVLEISAAKEDTQLAGTTPTEARTQVTAGELAFLAYAVQMNIPAREVDRSRWLVRAELPDPVLSGKTVGTLLRFKFRGEEIPNLPDWRQSGAL